MSHPASATDPSAGPLTRLWKKATRGRFLLISILAHLLFAAAAVYLVVQTFTPRKQLFKPGPQAAENKAVEHKITMVKKQNAMSAPVQTTRITTKGLSKVALPDIPMIPNENPTAPSAMNGMGGTGTAFTPGGMGSGSGTAGGGMLFFGLRDSGKGLKGTLYDLKQTRDFRPTNMNPDQYSKEVRRFVLGGWNETQFGKYFQAPNPLYAPQILIPNMKADAGPKAFGLADKVQPRMWVIVYSGTVTPPEDGRYRFVGKGDDIMIVRFNHQIVLDWGQPDAGKLSNWRPKDKAYKYDEGSRYGFMPGDWVEVKAGTPYPIQILIGERPGGDFQAGLMVEKSSTKYEKDNHGNPILPLFHLAGSPPMGLQKRAPVFDPKGAPWRMVQAP